MECYSQEVIITQNTCVLAYAEAGVRCSPAGIIPQGYIGVVILQNTSLQMSCPIVNSVECLLVANISQKNLNLCRGSVVARLDIYRLAGVIVPEHVTFEKPLLQPGQKRIFYTTYKMRGFSKLLYAKPEGDKVRGLVFKLKHNRELAQFKINIYNPCSGALTAEDLGLVYLTTKWFFNHDCVGNATDGLMVMFNSPDLIKPVDNVWCAINKTNSDLEAGTCNFTDSDYGVSVEPGYYVRFSPFSYNTSVFVKSTLAIPFEQPKPLVFINRTNRRFNIDTGRQIATITVHRFAQGYEKPITCYSACDFLLNGKKNVVVTDFVARNLGVGEELDVVDLDNKKPFSVVRAHTVPVRDIRSINTKLAKQFAGMECTASVLLVEVSFPHVEFSFSKGEPVCQLVVRNKSVIDLDTSCHNGFEEIYLGPSETVFLTEQFI
ncbi:UL20 envelope protein [Bufonid herpesvirus 1]|uniref:UL20 envelope protein n=1 Tax=Bufonid herpesvirus 1 TaxID=2282206 RepID=UPI000EB7157B|nr:UL20 envelope protein [Bufonid herpesvirus 1]AXF48513.1 UL20 envelope protein [Bufonid herpesvirus 1]